MDLLGRGFRATSDVRRHDVAIPVVPSYRIREPRRNRSSHRQNASMVRGILHPEEAAMRFEFGMRCRKDIIGLQASAPSLVSTLCWSRQIVSNSPLAFREYRMRGDISRSVSAFLNKWSILRSKKAITTGCGSYNRHLHTL